jgi:hypothetical protein
VCYLFVRSRQITSSFDAIKRGTEKDGHFWSYKMAVNYPAQNHDPIQSPFYPSQQQPSPTDSAPPTPRNVSPTSPRMDTYVKYQLPSHVRQLRPPKSPLYVPAVLRPTERPVRQPPMTPPKSLHGSLDSLEGAGLDRGIDADVAPPFDFVFPEEELGEVTGPPNKDHWKVRNDKIESNRHSPPTLRQHASCLG